MGPILEDWRTAPIDGKVRATIALLETFTLRPDEMAPEAVRAALDAGVTRAQVRDAFYVAFLFNTYDRLADTLGWEQPDEGFHRKSGKFLLKHGYE